MKYLLYSSLVSIKAIVESYKIRKLHHSLPSVVNMFFFFRDWLAFKFFIFKNQFYGAFFK